jgi:hypothetical protein
MTDRHCPRQWEAEAIHDGRVAGPERQSFEAHLSRCRVCREHADDLEAYAQKLKELPSGLPDAFTLRRQRQALLEQFNAALVAPSRRLLHGSVPIFSGVFAAIVSIAFLRLRSAPSRWIEMRAATLGAWSETRQGDSERIVLREGHFDLAIHRPSASSRVLLVLPDGEIEDLGTALEVWISNGQTIRVSVKSGEVVVRLRGLATTHLRAGQQWVRDGQARSATSISSPTLVAPVTDASSTGSGITQPVPPAVAVAPRRPPGVTATAAAGRNPGAPKVHRDTEDSAYLRVLELLDQGRTQQAKVAADAYLAEYPHGFRRLEILDIEKRLTH